MLYATDLPRDDLPFGDLWFLFTAALVFRDGLPAPVRERSDGAATAAAPRTLVLTVSGSVARFSVISWVALVSVPAA
ncbi:MAG: hypothetical protein WB683_19035 [Candidatus Sulfotelmatobacter sp.]